MRNTQNILTTVSLAVLLFSNTAIADREYYPVVGENPRSVCCIDLNGDGAEDIVTANKDSKDISILFNNGHGIFADPVIYPAGEGPSAVRCADLDLDGDSDIVVANYASDDVTVFVNDGYGAFISYSTYGVEKPPETLLLGDLNSDNYMDILVLCDQDCDTTSILLNNGDGTFSEAIAYTVDLCPTAFYLIDFDVDGDNDLAIAHGARDGHPGKVVIHPNNGDGSFGQGIEYVVEGFAQSVFSIDLDSDDDSDLIVGCGSSGFSILFNLGDGTFSDPIAYNMGFFAGRVYSIDLDSDGDNDLIFAGMIVVFNNGDGTFDYEWDEYKVWSSFFSSHCCDIDMDGDNDIITTDWVDDLVVLLLNEGDGTFCHNDTYRVKGGPIGLCSIDLDSDGDDDIVTANFDSSSVTVLLNDGNGVFNIDTTYVVGYRCGPMSVLGADLDADDDNDIVVYNYGSQSVSVLLNNGDGTLADKSDYSMIDAIPYSGYTGSHSLCLADLDGDGDYDIVALKEIYLEFALSVFLNNGDGTFGEEMECCKRSGFYVAIYAEDLNCDEDIDVVIADMGVGVLVLFNNGDGTFGEDVEIYYLGVLLTTVYSIDLDCDNDNDIVAASGAPDNYIHVFFNNGEGTFGDDKIYQVGDMPNSICSADFEGDGDNDLIVACWGAPEVWTLINDGNGDFTIGKIYQTRHKPYSVFSTDLDGDGKSDIIACEPEGNYVSVFLSTTTGVDDHPLRVELPSGYALYQNYPNPFPLALGRTGNLATTIGYQLTSIDPIRTTLKVYNILGQEVRTLVDEEEGAGSYTVIWDGKDDHGNELTSGLYLYKLSVGNWEKSRKMIVLK